MTARLTESVLSTVKRVLIVGGGIAGMSMAIELRKRAIDVDLVEADPDQRRFLVGWVRRLRDFATSQGIVFDVGGAA